MDDENFNDAVEIDYNEDVNQLVMALKALHDGIYYVMDHGDKRGWSSDMQTALIESLSNEQGEISDELKKFWSEISGEE